MRLRNLLLAGAGVVAGFPSAGAADLQVVHEVDPFLGTGGAGHTHPAASYPSGLVQLGPDTRLEGWEGCSGYWYPETHVYGFSHTHLSGTGVGDYLDVMFMPGTGEPLLTPGSDDTPGYRARFDHAHERAEPGYYEVLLPDSGIQVALTVTPHTGLHRYTFPSGAAGHVVLDLTHGDQVIETSLEVVSPTEIRGCRRSRGWAVDQPVYFAAEFSRPMTAVGTAAGTSPVRETPPPGPGDAPLAVSDPALRAYFRFGPGEPLLLKVGVSSVDETGARNNLDSEQPGWDFDAVRAAATGAWARDLNRITVRGGTPEQRTVFYTALYHLLLHPNLLSDIDGRYRARDGSIGRVEAGKQYTVFSLWDTFRAAHPLYLLLDPQRTADFANTMLRQYRDGGLLPVWELWGNETNCMIGYHAVPVLAEAVLKGVPGVDPEAALEAMLASASTDRRGLPGYRRYGFIPAEEEGESVSQTLEYAYDDACIAKVAARLGRDDVARVFAERAQGYRHLFDPDTGFFRARLYGHWFTPFDPARVDFNYTEANAWQYGFFVPQDVDGLMALYGGPDRFAAKLDALFGADSALHGIQQSDITGLIGQYAHGNEPSHHMAYLYAYAGQPWKTQALVRRILTTLYGTGPEGLPGNEDCGQMSAWYVFSALGLYPVDPCSDHYVLGSPLFPEATLHLGNGHDLVIRTEGDVARDAYVQRATWKGAPLDRAWLRTEEVLGGGELVFTVGPKSSPWGSAPESSPHTWVAGPRVTAAPFASGADALFSGETEVTLADADPMPTIRYTLDGSEPGSTSPVFGKPFVVRETCTVRARASRHGAASPVADIRFWKRPEGRHVALRAAYSPQYGGGGDDALVDGLRGKANFRLGAWQGFQGQDLDATVDLGRVETVHRLSLSCLQDTRSWIVFPLWVDFEASEDGVSFTPVGRGTQPVPVPDLEVQTGELAVTFPPRPVRYIRLLARSYGPLPDWHPGAGGPSYIFTDELIIE